MQDVIKLPGRKFDRIQISDGVRYFVNKKTGEIFGARSYIAPNLKWYFGTLDTVDQWNWSDYHGRPLDDTTVRAIKQYGPYTHYMKI